VRSEPSINGNVIAILSLNDEIEIVDDSVVDEEINGINGFWLKKSSMEILPVIHIAEI
jgi:hypothetical protein